MYLLCIKLIINCDAGVAPVGFGGWRAQYLVLAMDRQRIRMCAACEVAVAWRHAAYAAAYAAAVVVGHVVGAGALGLRAWRALGAR